MALFENYEQRITKVNEALAKVGINSVEEAYELVKSYGIDPLVEVKDVQKICFEDACWAYVVGVAIAIKNNANVASDAAKYIGEGLQAFCIDGSAADQRCFPSEGCPGGGRLQGWQICFLPRSHSLFLHRPCEDPLR